MAELGYRPNHAARALARGSSRTIGVVTQGSNLFGPASVLAGFQVAAADANFSVAVASLPTLNGQTLVSAVEGHLAQQVAGIVVIAPVESANDALELLPEDLPVVAIDGDPNRPTGLVTIDQVGGAGLATQHLLEAGHRTVWHISGPPGWFDSAGRESGWRAALGAGGREVPPVLHADWSLASGYRAGQTLAKIPELSAIFAANDHLAFGAMKALREAKRVVPDDVSVVGFDDIAEAAYIAPALTTIRPDFAELGRRALAMLVDQIDHGKTPQTYTPLMPSLVERDSVAPPRG